ncbi:MAG: FG-GAP-like repeat-containing protein, partial [Candidatus Thorarchaeota archaeon]
AMVQTTPGTRIAAEQVPVLRQAFTTTDQTPVLLWSYTTEDWVCSSAALGDVDGDMKLEVVIGSRDDKVYCLNGEDGSVLWSYTTGASIDSSAALGDVDGDGKLEVVIGSYDHKVYALNFPQATDSGFRVYWQGLQGDPYSNTTRCLTFIDPDNDMLSSYTEDILGTSPANSDTDSDGMPDGWEVVYGLNATDSADASLDNDSDGLTNLQEYQDGTSPQKADSDGDGLGDGAEVNTYGTNPQNSDTDDDGMPDGWEVDHALNATDPSDAGLDADGDGLTNLGEYQNGTDPQNSDTDNDGMPDSWEVDHALNATDPSDAGLDADGDGLTNLGEYQNGTNPKSSDTDNDGMPDGWEVDHALDATDSSDAGLDADSDGLTNLAEYQNGTDPQNADTDSDGMPDGWELDNDLNPLLDDAANDPDRDGFTNLDEYRRGTNPLVPEATGPTESLTWGIVATLALVGMPVLVLALVGLKVRSKRRVGAAAESGALLTRRSVDEMVFVGDHGTQQAAPRPSHVIQEPVAAEMGESLDKRVVALRGCAVVGGRFEYKVKVMNNTPWVITNVTVTVLSYPEDCLEIDGPLVKSIKRIGPGEFRSPQFTFIPTKDCVEGRILATVNYLDYQNKPHSIDVEPYVIRSVCDLLLPLESTLEQFDSVIRNMDVTRNKLVLHWNPKVLFSKIKAFLPTRNFHIVEAKADTVSGIFSGTIKGLAEGKYTGKRVAVRILITGPEEGNEAKVVIEGLGDDVAMLPTTVSEISESIDSWTCLRCGGLLSPSQVQQMKAGVCIQCSYCGAPLTIDLYKK